MKKNQFFTTIISLLTITTLWSNPKIGIVLNPQAPNFIGESVTFFISVKNMGSEPLYNISIDHLRDQNGNLIYDSFDIFNSVDPSNQNYVIPQLDPGEMDNNTFYGHIVYADCDYEFQLVASSIDGSNNDVTDLSDQYSYLNNNTTLINVYGLIEIIKEGIYQDLNANDIIDVGDAVLYTYTNIAQTGLLTYIEEVNADYLDSDNMYIYDGKQAIHYLTQAEIDLGYVYGKTNGVFECYGEVFVTQSPSCNCSIPSGYDFALNLTGLTPNKITGKVTYDQNADNCATGAAIRYSRVTANNGTYDYATFTNSTSGNYQIIIPNNGQYNVDSVLSNNTHFAVNPTNYSISSSGENTTYADNDFCVSSAANYTDLEVRIYPANGLPSRPGFASDFRIAIVNNGSTNFDGNVQLTFDNGKVTYTTASTSPDAATSNTLSWNFSNLLPFERRNIIVSFDVATPPTVNSGDILPFVLSSTTSLTDNVLSNNTFNLNQEVVNSYDPNDITVLGKTDIEVPELEKDIYYLVRFQNTGTASAINVVVKQTLDNNLDWDTFEPVDSSDEALTMIKNGNEVTYTFSQINLPDSNSNEPESHGWFIYKIKPKSTLNVGDFANAQANIYFDYNLPITTNEETVEVVEALSSSTFTNGNGISVYPNPANNFISINITDAVSIESISIYNTLGQKVMSQNKDFSTVHVEPLQRGIYSVVITANKEKHTLKFIKE